jgi:hypothetical protein
MTLIGTSHNRGFKSCPSTTEKPLSRRVFAYLKRSRSAGALRLVPMLVTIFTVFTLTAAAGAGYG